MVQDKTFIPDAQHRIVCPALKLDPPNTSPTLYSGALNHFTSIPWCAAHLQAPGAISFIPACRNPASPWDNQILGKTLATEQTVAHILSFVEPADAAHALHPTRHIPKVHTLFATGDGVSGYPGVVQGGLVMALIDEAMSAVLEINMVLGKEGAAFQTNSVTGSMDMRFLKPVPTGEAVRAVAWIENVEGRRTKIVCQMFNEDGVELAKCTSTWVALKSNM
jgi:acyl-coenzyme A thioesterase PaaI-like protein